MAGAAPCPTPGALTPRREALPDALRALALVGVLVVNALAYQDQLLSAVGARPTPDGSVPAMVALWLSGTLLQGKAYPLLALLFGMGLAYAARGLTPAQARARTRRRAWRLLGLGVVHGVVLYYGDVLTIYALVALTLASLMREPWRTLRPRLRRAFAWSVAAWALGLVLTALAFGALPRSLPDGADEGVLAVARSVGWRDFVQRNATEYAWMLSGALVLYAPLIRWLMLLGVAAVRLKLLTHRRWRAAWARFARRATLPLLAVNGVVAAVSLDAVPGSAWPSLLGAAAPLWGLPLTAAYVALAVLAWHRGEHGWARRLAPLGGRTLSLYIAGSVALVTFTSGAGLGLEPTTLQWVAAALCLWGAAAWGAARSTRRWPLEAWMARR